VRAKLNARKEQREEATKINELITYKQEKAKSLEMSPYQVRPWGKLDEPPSPSGRQAVESLPKIASAEPSPRQQGSPRTQKSPGDDGEEGPPPASVAPARDAEAEAALRETRERGLALSAEEPQQPSQRAAEDGATSSAHSPSPHSRGGTEPPATTSPSSERKKQKGASPRRTRVPAVKEQPQAGGGDRHGTQKQSGPLASFVLHDELLLDEQLFKVQLRAAMGLRAAWCVDVFKDFDRGTGAIGRADFHRALRRLGLTDAVPRKLVDALFTSWDVDCSKTLDVIELRRVLRRETERDPTGKMSDDAVYLLEVRAREAKRLAMREQAAARRQLAQSLEGSGRDLAVQMKAIAKQEELYHALGANQKEIVQLFESWDADGDGQVSKAEFRNAMRVLGLENDRETIDALFDMFDFDSSGNVGLPELKQALQWAYRGRRSKLIATAAPSKPPTEHVAGSAQDRLYEALTANATRVIELFQFLDVNEDGAVSQKEFRRAPSLLGIKLPLDEVDALFDTFDADGLGMISFKELHRLLHHDQKLKRKQLRKAKAEHREEVADPEQLRREAYQLYANLDDFIVSADDEKRKRRPIVDAAMDDGDGGGGDPAAHGAAAATPRGVRAQGGEAPLF